MISFSMTLTPEDAVKHPELVELLKKFMTDSTALLAGKSLPVQKAPRRHNMKPAMSWSEVYEFVTVRTRTFIDAVEKHGKRAGGIDKVDLAAVLDSKIQPIMATFMALQRFATARQAEMPFKYENGRFTWGT